MKNLKTVRNPILLLGLISFVLLVTSDPLLSLQKRKGSINLSLGKANSNDYESGNFGLLKSIDWNLRSGWASGGINFGIVKNEILLMGNISVKIPLNRIEPFITAGFGIILESLNLASNFGGGIRIRVGKKIGIIAEYRKMHFKYRANQRHTKSLIAVDFFGAGLFYFF